MRDDKSVSLNWRRAQANNESYTEPGHRGSASGPPCVRCGLRLAHVGNEVCNRCLRAG